jgi:deoxycytidine triphosphate deaminase
MFINPKQAIDEGWLRGIDPGDVQPNAVDIAVDGLYEVDKTKDFALLKESKSHRGVNEVHSQDDTWYLDPGHAYDFTSPSYVEVPKGVVGWLVTRSTLNRNGVFVLSGLYDSGFKGHLCGVLYNLVGATTMEVGSRVAQFIMARSDSVGVYSGGYNIKEGQVWHGK